MQRTWKQSESLVLRVVPDEEFLHTKINNKDVYVDYGATEDIPDGYYTWTALVLLVVSMFFFTTFHYFRYVKVSEKQKYISVVLVVVAVEDACRLRQYGRRFDSIKLRSR